MQIKWKIRKIYFDAFIRERWHMINCIVWLVWTRGLRTKFWWVNHDRQTNVNCLPYSKLTRPSIAKFRGVGCCGSGKNIRKSIRPVLRCLCYERGDILAIKFDWSNTNRQLDFNITDAAIVQNNVLHYFIFKINKWSSNACYIISLLIASFFQSVYAWVPFHS